MDFKCKLSFGTLACELFREIRGEKSQNWIDKHLGYTKNTCSRLENGTIKISWYNFYELCQLRRIDIETKIFSHAGYCESVSSPETLLGHLLFGKSKKETAALLELSESQLNRILNGQSKTTMALILMVLHKVNWCLFNVLESIVDPKKLESLSEDYATYQEHSRLNNKYQFTALVLNFLELDVFKSAEFHKAKNISKTLNLPLRDIQNFLIDFESVGLIKRVGEIYRVYDYPFFMYKTPNPENLFENKLYWMTYVKDLFHKRKFNQISTDGVGCVIYNSNDDLNSKIQDLVSKFYLEFIELTNHADQNHDVFDEVKIMNLNHLTLVSPKEYQLKNKK